jgi:hypothetical protein
MPDIVADYGAVGDAEWVTTTLNITAGTTTLTASDPVWTSGDVGKNIVLPPPPFGSPHWTTISAFVSPTQITLAANATSTLTSYAAIVAWGTDSTAAFQAFKDDYQNDTVTLTIPAGTYLISSGNFLGLWNGIRNITVNATGATLCGATFTISASAQYEAPGHTARTASVSAGATSVTLLTPAESSRFAVGDYAMMTGQDMMHYGYPTNHALFEYLKITAINAGTGKVTFETPLVYSYLSTWPVYNATGTDYGGPATLYAMHPNFNHTAVINGLTLAHHSQWGTGALSLTFNDCVFEGIAGAFPSMGKSITYNNCTGVDATMEIDKLVTAFTMIGCTWGGLNMQSTAIDLMTLDNTTILFSLLGSARKTVVRNGCSIGTFCPGPSFFGYAHELEVSDSVISSFGSETYHESGGSFFKGSGGIGIQDEFSMADGVITVPAALRMSGIGQIAVTGARLFFHDAMVGTIGSFTITDVTDDAGDILVHTDWEGGFPARSYNPALGLWLLRHPAPISTFDNVTGCPEVVDLSGATPGEPLYSWSRRTYDGAAAAGPYWQMYGRVKYLKVNVTTPYTGATGTVNATLNLGNALIATDYSDTAWAPVIDLKTTGARIFDATAGSYPASWAGAQSGDTLPGMSEALWCPGNFRVTMTDISGEDAGTWPQFTVEFITDQGLASSSEIPIDIPEQPARRSMIDFSALLYDPVYAEIGVPATLVASGTAGQIALTVIDDTRPKTLIAGSAEVRSVGPGAFVRIPELAENGIAREDYIDAMLAFNGRTWAVRSYELRGSPNGEDLGEVRFLLKAVGSTGG